MLLKVKFMFIFNIIFAKLLEAILLPLVLNFLDRLSSIVSDFFSSLNKSLRSYIGKEDSQL